jgi:hypothetical protein
MSDLLARTWVALYTCGLPADCRDARRAEIRSDLWEQRHDGGHTGLGSNRTGALGRVLAGMPADVSWRIDEGGVARASLGSRQELLRRQVIIIPGIAVLVGLVTLAGQPGTVAALLAGLMALALVGLTRGLTLSPVAASSGKDTSMETGITSTLRRRTTLLIVLGVSMIVLAATYAYALSLDHWGDTREWIFMSLGWGSLVIGVGALSLLIGDIVRTRRR